MDVESGEKGSSTVAAVFELLTLHHAGPWRLGGVDTAFGLHPGFLVHREHQAIIGRIQIESADVGGFLPEVGVVRSQPRPGLPGFEVEVVEDPPDLGAGDPGVLNTLCEVSERQA